MEGPGACWEEVEMPMVEEGGRAHSSQSPGGQCPQEKWRAGHQPGTVAGPTEVHNPQHFCLKL